MNTTTGADVRTVALSSGTHAWAGEKDHANDIPGIGEPDETFNASDRIAQFFLDHSLGH